MESRSVAFTYTVYQEPDSLPDDDLALLVLARRTMEHAWAPYSGFRVGAAVRLADGTMLAGANYENASYPLSLCAEKAVLAAAHAQHPNLPVVALAVVVANSKRKVYQPAAPCGGCRQVILETERKNKTPIRIIMQGDSGPIYVVEKGSELLPLAFDDSWL